MTAPAVLSMSRPEQETTECACGSQEESFTTSSVGSPAGSLASRTTRLQSSSGRTSVLSMKSLLPLRLSPSSSTTTSSGSPGEENIGSKLDCYFPEVLAENLEVYSEVFRAKNMSAGVPILSTPTERSSTPTRSRPTSHSHTPFCQHHNSSAHVPSLKPIEERHSRVSFPGHTPPSLEDSDSEMDSLSQTESSAPAEPASIRLREQSLMTATTSVTSMSRRPSPSSYSQQDGSRECSWIEAESDFEEPTETDMAALSPRPPTPPKFDLATGTVSTEGVQFRGGRRSGSKSHQKSYSLGAGYGASNVPKRQLSGRSADTALGKSASKIPRIMGKSHPKGLSIQLPPPVPTRSTARKFRPQLQVSPCPENHPYPYNTTFTTVTPVTAVTEPSPISEEYMDSEDTTLRIDPPSWARPNTVYIQPSPPPSPLPTVQSCLNDNTPQFTSNFTSDEVCRLVPLPPNVIETLRVSIACFPETMLLSSSLTLETIRAYSRKVRHPGMQTLRHTASESPMQQVRHVRGTIMKKISAYRNGTANLVIRNRDSRDSNQGSLPSTLSSTSLESPKPWLALKNVFGCCSDYICDALYAHLVAYNYISALVPPQGPRPKSSHQALKRGSTQSDSQSDDIPKKAATLLGIGRSGATAVQTHHPTNSHGGGGGRFAKRFNIPIGRWSSSSSGKDDFMAPMKQAPTSTSSAHDNAVRDIQAGLLRCITRLIATAKLMAESGTGEERMVEVEAREADVYFTRSLCEIVRLAEETA